ncbi:hypothetical protein Tfu_2934 [Thermobifida fusca YX]|nr:hypothetical protein Tfu_2934 [Thermobifida fusca YX]
MRGAHVQADSPAIRTRGPSPRAWGSPVAVGALVFHKRSIPTCVGLTPRGTVRGRGRAVHPHVRGAHPCTRSAYGCGWRSIPTCVGLTDEGDTVLGSDAVHPHVRGAHAYVTDCLRTGVTFKPRVTNYPLRPMCNRRLSWRRVS